MSPSSASRDERVTVHRRGHRPLTSPRTVEAAVGRRRRRPSTVPSILTGPSIEITSPSTTSPAVDHHSAGDADASVAMGGATSRPSRAMACREAPRPAPGTVRGQRQRCGRTSLARHDAAPSESARASHGRRRVARNTMRLSRDQRAAEMSPDREQPRPSGSAELRPRRAPARRRLRSRRDRCGRAPTRRSVRVRP